MPAPQKEHELEIRMGANRKMMSLSKMDYDRVVRKLMENGFYTTDPDGVHSLRILYDDKARGEARQSKLRTEIVGVHLIQNYCKTNDLQRLIQDFGTTHPGHIQFTRKDLPLHAADKSPIKPVDFADFNFRVSYQIETKYTVYDRFVQPVIRAWSTLPKKFRHLNRVRFIHPTMPLNFDVTVLKTSTKVNREMVAKNTIQESGVFMNAAEYELEFEVDAKRLAAYFGKNTIEEVTATNVMDLIRTGVRLSLGALQGSPFPIAYSEAESRLQSYMRLLHGSQYEPRRVLPRDFIGPMSTTLQLSHLLNSSECDPHPDNIDIVNDKHGGVLSNYCVTEKADGVRALLFVDDVGRVYFIDMTMRVSFTGMITKNERLFWTVLDGEHIVEDAMGNPCNLFMAFDAYFIGKKNCRHAPFLAQEAPAEEQTTHGNTRTNTTSAKLPPNASRLSWLREVREMLALECAPGTSSVETSGMLLRMDVKTFFSTNAIAGRTIFDACSEVMTRIHTGMVPYKTDGIIFTPTNLRVGGNTALDDAGPLRKITWEKSLKWKPPEFNTIDFLVSMKKNTETGQDEVGYLYKHGQPATTAYKTLVLRCGSAKPVFENPFHDMIHKRWNQLTDANSKDPSISGSTSGSGGPGDNGSALGGADDYRPYPFQPSHPADPEACFCRVALQGAISPQMFTEENEVFTEDMIVEFRYDHSREPGWKWVPLRVRYDKTNELLMGQKTYGNTYSVANSNWFSIHYPVDESMITTGMGMPDPHVDEDVYYNTTMFIDKSRSRALRDFHNKYVKTKILMTCIRQGNTVIDLSVGKAGDLAKWSKAGAGFVFGIDLAQNNIHDPVDGACARFLHEKQRVNSRCVSSCLFLVGNSARPLRELGDAFATDKDREIARAVFGSGPRDDKLLGEAVMDAFGMGKDGFQVSSCQFSIHYFFETEITLHTFLRNIAENTVVGGLFVGTCFDGERVFQLLKSEGGRARIMTDDGKHRLCEIARKYSSSFTSLVDVDGGEGDAEEIRDDEIAVVPSSCIGLAIDVYQDTINQTLREYLVYYPYLVRIMENYGFVEATETDIGALPATGLFEHLFDSLCAETERQTMSSSASASTSTYNMYGHAARMSDAEKQVSFLNRYFIFKKMRTVNAKDISDKAIRIAKKGKNKADDSKTASVFDATDIENGTAVVLHASLLKKRHLQIVLIQEPSSNSST